MEYTSSVCLPVGWLESETNRPYQCAAYEQSLVLKFHSFITHSLRKQRSFRDATTGSGAPNDNILQNHLNIALLNVI